MKHEDNRIFFKTTIPISSDDQDLINGFFKSNPHLKKGLTIRGWIIGAIKKAQKSCSQNE